MAEQKLRLTRFDGGLSDDDKYGVPNSFSKGQQIDFRRAPGVLTLQRKLAKESGSTVTTDIHDMQRVSTGEIYMAGGTKIYKRSPGANGAAGSYSVSSSDASLIGVRDLDYYPNLDKLFAYDQSAIHELYSVSGTATWDYNKYTNYVVLNQNDGTITNTYTLSNAITETAVNLVSFTCTAEPLYSVTFKVAAKGASGDWTVTVHDGANRAVATATVLFASVPAGGNDIEFVFATPVRLEYNASYHLHLTASSGTNTVYTLTASDLSTADVSTKAQRLVNTGEYGHFTMQFGPQTIFCNDRYIGSWEVVDTSANATTGFSPHRVVLPSECVGIGAAIYNSYAAVACGLKRSSDTQNSNALTNGIIFFWDGESANYLFSLDVPQGVPYGLFSRDNILYWTCDGQLYRWAGGDIQMIFEFPGVDEFTPDPNGPQTEVYLHAARRSIASQNSLIKVGFPHTTANTKLEIGVYSWGNSKGFMPKAIGYDHILSTASGTTVFDTATVPYTPVTGITCIKQFGNNILVAWKDVVNGVLLWGVDYVNDKSAVQDGRYLSMVFDDGRPDEKKTALGVIAVAKQLPAGCTVTPIIEYDRSDTFVNEDGTVQMSPGETYVKFDVHRRFRECRFGIDLESLSGNFPEAIALVLKYDDNFTEQDESADLDTQNV